MFTLLLFIQVIKQFQGNGSKGEPFEGIIVKMNVSVAGIPVTVRTINDNIVIMSDTLFGYHIMA